MTRYKRPNGILLMPSEDGEFILHSYHIATVQALEAGVNRLELENAYLAQVANLQDPHRGAMTVKIPELTGKPQ